MDNRKNNHRSSCNNNNYEVEAKQSNPPYNFEQLLEYLGGFGRFQFLSLILILSLEVPAACMSFVPIFTGTPPKQWYCDDFPVSSEEVCNCNGTLGCPESSIVTQWNLVCDSEWVSDFITSLQQLGMVVGCIVAGKLSDWYGRKHSFLATVLIMAVGSGASAVVNSPYLYGFARFLCGAGLAGYFGISSVYSMEFQTPKWRPLGGAAGPWGEGIIILAVVAYYVPQWRQLTIITALPFLLIIVIYPILPESPRYLLRNKKTAEAHHVLNQIATMNGKPELSLEFVQKLAAAESIGSNSQSTGVTRLTYLDLFRKDLRWSTIYLLSIWAAWSTVNFGIAFNIKNFPGDLYFNVALLGLTDVLGYPLSWFVAHRLGRKKSLALFMILAALFLAVASVVEWMFLVDRSHGKEVALVLLCLLGKLGISGARGSVRTITGETFPTAIRSMGTCMCLVSSGFASIFAPQLAFLGTKWPIVPYFAFAGISIIGALISLLLKETGGKALSDEIQPETHDLPVCPSDGEASVGNVPAAKEDPS